VVESINDPYCQAKARAEVAGVMAHAGFDDRSRLMAGQAEDVTRDITWRRQTAVAVVLVGAGFPEHAGRVVSSITDAYERALALAEMAVALARTRHDEAHAVAEEAKQVAGSITCEYQQALAMAEVTWAMACTGHDDAAHAVAVEAERVARGISDAHREMKSLAELAVALARAGFHDEAERVARDFTDRYGGLYLPRVAVALARTGNGDAAKRVAQSITNVCDRAEALSAVAQALADRAEELAEYGDHGRARTAAGQAGRVARTITDSWQQTKVLANVARALTAAGFHDEAERVARSINDSGSRPPAEAAVVKDLIRAAQHSHAERVAMAISDQNDRALALAEVAVAMARAGHCKDAQRVVALAEPLAWRGGSSPSQILRALTDLAVAQSWAGAPAPAHVTTSRIKLEGVLAALAGVLAHALAQAWHFGQVQATGAVALTMVVVVLVVARHRDRSCPPGTPGTLVWDLTQSGDVFDPDEKARAMAEVARALAQAGHHKQAEIMARSITRSGLREKAMTEVAEARASHHRRAQSVAPGTEVATRPSIGPGLQARSPGRLNKDVVRAAVAACSYGEWSSLVGLVLELDPAAVSVINDLLRPLSRPGDAHDVSPAQHQRLRVRRRPTRPTIPTPRPYPGMGR
jgi:tetratricopeptide (TPR) repeat protein